MSLAARLRSLCDAFLGVVTPPRQRRDPRCHVPLRVGYLRAVVDAPRADGDAGLPWLSDDELDEARRLGYWPGQELREDFAEAYSAGALSDAALERPWNYRWDALPKRSAGPGFSRDDYRQARERGREVARATLGEELWAALECDGYLDLPSRLLPGISYRLRVGRRIEVIPEPDAASPWYYDFLCINPAYPLPEYEFFAQLYLYVRDQEDEVLRVAAPQPWDQALGRTF